MIRDEWRGDMRESSLVKHAQTHSNVVLTPHFGGGTVKSIVDARVFTARKLAHYERTGEVLSAEETMPFDDWPPVLDPALAEVATPGKHAAL